MNVAEFGRIFAEQPVAVVYLFGSQARGDSGPLSDVDIAVLLTGQPTAEECAQQQLALLDKVTAYLRRDDVDVVILNRAPLLLQHRVIRDGKVLFCRDDLYRVRYEAQTIMAYLDFRYYQERYFDALKDRILREGLGARYRGHRGAAGQTG
ncbi:MAG: nucleotidyltransferase domain-containing protein [Anaerolineae bacterium]|nr:nucleotidyltransferase domain-containing protein [Anaerolineae bacterium]